MALASLSLLATEYGYGYVSFIIMYITFCYDTYVCIIITY